ncbi:hypothetical protein LCGC14_0203460 [marine sediment metagenome]|uniref:30S ribosomal protein S6 n=1 Tax=marine sediment metagenome TaxID=412755 RepID=A0A0F9UMD4_9ZZZZ
MVVTETRDQTMAQKRTYEGMFLMPTGQSDFEALSQPIHAVLDRAKADLLTIKPWDERRLAYDIDGHKRGMYVLAYFNMDPAHVTEMERDIKLKEGILRALLLRRDSVTDEVLNADTPALVAARRPKRESPASESSADAPAPDAPAADAKADTKPKPKGEPEATSEAEASPKPEPPPEPEG